MPALAEYRTAKCENTYRRVLRHRASPALSYVYLAYYASHSSSPQAQEYRHDPYFLPNDIVCMAFFACQTRGTSFVSTLVLWFEILVEHRPAAKNLILRRLSLEVMKF